MEAAGGTVFLGMSLTRCRAFRDGYPLAYDSRAITLSAALTRGAAWDRDNTPELSRSLTSLDQPCRETGRDGFSKEESNARSKRSIPALTTPAISAQTGTGSLWEPTPGVNL